MVIMGDKDLIALVLGSELLYYYTPSNVFMPLTPIVKFLGPWDNGNFLSLSLIIKFVSLCKNGIWEVKTSLKIQKCL